jgi:hypothetical protein
VVEVEDEDMGDNVLSCEISGFANSQLNTIYSISSRVLVGNREIYWSEDRKHFMYLQASQGIWQICPRWQPPREPGRAPVDLLMVAQQGGNTAVAYQLENKFWQEFVDGHWQMVHLKIQFCASQGSQALPGEAQFPPTAPAAPVQQRPQRALPPPGLKMTDEPVPAAEPIDTLATNPFALQPISVPAASKSADAPKKHAGDNHL